MRSVLTALATMAVSTAAMGQIGDLRFGDMTSPGVPGGEMFQRITGSGQYFVYGLTADDGIKKQSVSFVAAPLNPATGVVDIQFISFSRSIKVDPDENIDAATKGVVMIVDFEKVDSDLSSLDEVEEEEENQEQGVTRVPVIYWPWWLVDYEDGSVGAEGTRVLCIFGFSSKYTNGRRMIAVLLDGKQATIQHPLLPDGYLDINKIGRGFELEWGTNADGDEKLSVNGDEVNPGDTFKPERWDKLGTTPMNARTVELLKEYHSIRKSPTAKH